MDDKAAARLGLSVLRALDSQDEAALDFIRMMHNEGEVFSGALAIAQAFAQALAVESQIGYDRVLIVMDKALEDRDDGQAIA